MISAIVLAAGLSRRMGRPKLLLALQGKPIVRWSVEALLPHVDEVIVVTGPDDRGVGDALRDLPVRLVVNPDPDRGQASSIVTGLAAVQPNATGAVIALGDQPRLPTRVVPDLLAVFEARHPAIVAPVYRGVRGNPVVFAASVFPELMALSGDVGARAVVDARPERVELVGVDAPMPRDVDTPEDFETLQVQ